MPNIRLLLAALFISLPWLNPFTLDPSVAVLPWLVSLGCSGALLVVAPGLKPQQRGTLLFAALCSFFLLHWRLQGGRYGAELMGTLTALMVFWSSVSAGLGIAGLGTAPVKNEGVISKIRHQPLRWLALTWLIVALISCVLGLLQYFGGAQFFSPWINQPLHLGEAFANLRQRNLFATLTSIGFAALLGLLLQSKWNEQAKSEIAISKWVYGAMVLLALGNASSGSRTGLLEWILILACTAGWNWPIRRRVVLFALQAVLVYLAASVVLPWLLGMGSEGLFDRFNESEPCISRRVLWSNVLTLIAQKPWFGWGWGQLDYAHFVTLFPDGKFCQIVDNAHNLPLHLAVELGIPAALTICGVAGWLVWRAKPWRETDPLQQMIWGVMAVIMLHSLVEFPLWYGAFQMTFGLGIGVLWANSEKGLVSRMAAVNKESKIIIPIQGKAQSYPVILSMLCFIIFLSASVSYSHVRQIYLPSNQRYADYSVDTLMKVQKTLFFPDQARFALLMSVSVVTADNAKFVYSLAKELLHYSPEAPVVERLIDAAAMLGRDDEVKFYSERFKISFPEDYAKWIKKYNH